MNRPRPVVLLTDYGTRDAYAGVLKGVIASISSEIPVIDLSHEIEPGDILHAALSLWMANRYFPPGSVFCCVVDPGVGTTRKAICCQSRGFRYIGPDNGLFTFVTNPDDPVWRIENLDYILPNPSTTFHGRDIFAPAAAHAAMDVPLRCFGRKLKDMVRFPSPLLEVHDGETLTGEVLFADRFGNILTSLGRFEPVEENRLRFEPSWGNPIVDFEGWQIQKKNLRMQLPGDQYLQLVDTFADIPPGECAVLVGSSGLLEIIANQANAREILGLKQGERVSLYITGE